ncbi:hypothetical protein JCM14469_35260 [Desulfatiferula olefinivorans]
MHEKVNDGQGLSPSDAKLLMCALLLCGAEDEIKPAFATDLKISDSRRVDEAVRAAYRAMVRPDANPYDSTFKMKRI